MHTRELLITPLQLVWCPRNKLQYKRRPCSLGYVSGATETYPEAERGRAGGAEWICRFPQSSACAGIAGQSGAVVRGWDLQRRDREAAELVEGDGGQVAPALHCGSGAGAV